MNCSASRAVWLCCVALLVSAGVLFPVSVRGAEVPLRHVHTLSATDVMLLMPAWDERLIVTKLVTAIPGAPSTVCATVLAVDRATGHPLAVLDGEAVTLRRTAATSALAARHLARADADTVLVVGAGRLAAWMARAHAALRPGLARLLVWGRRGEAALQLAQALQSEGLPAQAVPVDGLPAAVRDRLFEPCTSTKAGGTGVGLALSFQLAQQAGGTLELVRSDAGGTSFRLVLAPEA